MKVVAFNGSPNGLGNTYQALRYVGDEIEKAGIEFKIIQVGNKNIRGCMACGNCSKSKDEKCIFADSVNEWIQEIKQADGLLLGSPVHWAAMGGTMKSFLDRAFYVASANGGLFRHKVGASVVAVRRSGGLPTFEQLNHYIQYAEMFMPTSNYWNVIHGRVAEEAKQDEEGVQIMRVLGKNMSWLMKVVELGKIHIPIPEQEAKIYTNFVR
ncbi:FMN reductase [Bacteroidales bacterium]|nr:FMN reductase [Bacteroidales bacterium]